jgi:hypothetical protein
VGAAVGLEAIYLGSQGGRGLKRGQALAERLLQLAADHPDPYLEWYSHATRGSLDFFAGSFPSATQHFQNATETAEQELVGGAWEFDNSRLFLLFIARFRGAFAEATEHAPEYLREAERRGDLFAGTSFRRYSWFVWLAADDPARARAELERAEWTPPESGYHLPHYYEIPARAEIALYTGNERAGIEQLRPQFDALERSLLTRAQIVRTDARWSEGRLLVACALHGKDDRARYLPRARALARRLRRERIGYAVAWGELLRAAIAAQQRAWPLSLSSLDAAHELANAHGMSAIAAAAAWRKGQILAGDEGSELIARSEAKLADLGAKKPDKIAVLLTPGFPTNDA